MRDVIFAIGFILLSIGASCADSECLLIPIVITFTGALLMYFGSKEDIKK